MTYSTVQQPIEFHSCSFLVLAMKKRQMTAHESSNNRFLSSISFWQIALHYYMRGEEQQSCLTAHWQPWLHQKYVLQVQVLLTKNEKTSIYMTRIFLTILEDMCLLTCTRHWIFNIKKLVCRGSKVVKVTCVTADVLIGLKVKTVYPVPPCVFLSMTQEALSSRCREFFLTMSLIVECEDACAPKGNRSGECGTGGC